MLFQPLGFILLVFVRIIYETVCAAVPCICFLYPVHTETCCMMRWDLYLTGRSHFCDISQYQSLESSADIVFVCFVHVTQIVFSTIGGGTGVERLACCPSGFASKRTLGLGPLTRSFSGPAWWTVCHRFGDLLGVCHFTNEPLLHVEPTCVQFLVFSTLVMRRSASSVVHAVDCRY